MISETCRYCNGTGLMIGAVTTQVSPCGWCYGTGIVWWDYSITVKGVKC